MLEVQFWFEMQGDTLPLFCGLLANFGDDTCGEAMIIFDIISERVRMCKTEFGQSNVCTLVFLSFLFEPLVF